MKRFAAYLAALAAALAFTGCASTTKSGAIGIERQQFLLVSSETINAQAAKGYASTVSQAKSSRKLNVDAQQTARVKTIANRLIAHVGHFREDARDWEWEVNVFKDDTINAWCMPGGKIGVYTGIIDKLNLTDGELAAVMGHEIAHALREHSREQASTNVLQQIGVKLAAKAAKVDEGTVATVAKYGFDLPFSRKHESEADAIGLELMARAGYNPNEAVNVWRKMSAREGVQAGVVSKVKEFMSTHPSSETRIADLNAQVSTVMPLYESAPKASSTAVASRGGQQVKKTKKTKKTKK